MTKAELIRLKNSYETDITKNSEKIKLHEFHIRQTKEMTKSYRTALNDVYAQLCLITIKEFFTNKR